MMEYPWANMGGAQSSPAGNVGIGDDSETPPTPPNGGYDPNPGGQPAYNFWNTIDYLIGDQSASARLKSFLTGPHSKWKEPRNAQAMLEFALLAKDMDDDTTAQQMVWNVLNKGFTANSWSPSFASPLLQRWGLQYGQEGKG